MRVLVLGYGNPARRDDGLGPRAAAALEQLKLPDVTVDADYQLTVEDADACARHDVVVFIDAAVDGPEPFVFRRIEPGPVVMFSSHSATPEGVLKLTEELFHEEPEAYVLGIRGYEFNEFDENLSERAAANLAAALAFITPVLRARDFARHAAPAAPPAGMAAACAPRRPTGCCNAPEPGRPECPRPNRPSKGETR
ncbi:MAG: hydrogenase maturation protease [Planctomycetota bacterium]